MSPVLYALFANISFATASVYFATYSKKISASWVNYFKASIAFICFTSVTLVFGLQTDLPFRSVAFLSLSGTLGLFIGDIFLLKAFTHLGSGRVLMLFGFQPLILGVASIYLFNQRFSLLNVVAVIFLMGCLFTFSLESFKQKGHWDLKGLGYAIIGVGLDAAGVLLTKSAFEDNPTLSPFYANVFRSGAAVLGFFILSRLNFFQLSLFRPLDLMKKLEVLKIVMVCFLGTFVSLGFYMMAMKHGHLATVSAIAGTSPLFATLFETITGQKKLTAYLFIGTFFFLCGVFIIGMGSNLNSSLF